jgi:hypothetical protein
MRVLLSAVGAGFTWGTVVVEWGEPGGEPPGSPSDPQANGAVTG